MSKLVADEDPIANRALASPALGLTDSEAKGVVDPMDKTGPPVLEMAIADVEVVAKVEGDDVDR